MTVFTLSPFPGISLFLLLAGVMNLSLGLIVLANSAKKILNFVFFLLCACLAAWCFIHATISSGLSPAAMVWGCKATAVAALPIPFIFLILSQIFPSAKKDFILMDFLLAIPFAGLMVLALFSGLINAKIIYDSTVQVSLGQGHYLFTLYVIVYFGAAIWNMFIRYKKSEQYEKTRYKYFFVGLVLTTLTGVGLSLVLLSMGIYKFIYVGPLGTVFLVGFTAYSILKYRLMDINLVIKKTTAYSFITSSITFSYVLLVLAFEYVSRAVFGYYSFWSAVFASLVIAVTFNPMRAYLQSLTDRLFFRQMIEYQQIIREVTHLITSVINLNTLFRLIDRTIMRALCVSNVAIMLSEEQGASFRVEKTNGLPDELLQHQIPAGHPLISYLSSKKDAAVLDEIKELLARELSDEEKEKLKAIIAEFGLFAAAVAIPAFSRDKLIGILFLGEKLSGESYSSEDLDLLLTMASEAGIAIENAKLYRDVTETRDYLDSLVQGSEDAILTFNLQGNILSWNSGAEEIFGYKQAEVFGRTPPFFTGTETLDWIDRVKKREPIKAVEIKKRAKSGNELDLLLTLSPICDAAGKVIAVAAIIKDITQLRRLDSAKQEFLYSISNELRAPLTPIHAYLSLLLRGELGELAVKQKEALDVISSQSARLRNLIDSAIDISRIEAGRPLELAREPVFLDEIVKTVIENNRTAYQTKGIKLAAEYPGNKVALLADTNKLSRVMENLLGNAFKFTPAGGTVTITFKEENKRAVVTVADTGIGLAPDQLEKIFEKFYQVDSAYNRSIGGSGMGLTIAREIVEAHGGLIRAESAGLGRGAKFIFTLPVA
jgi:PAS domain S-box-containing protein